MFVAWNIVFELIEILSLIMQTTDVSCKNVLLLTVKDDICDDFFYFVTLLCFSGHFVPVNSSYIGSLQENLLVASTVSC